MAEEVPPRVVKAGNRGPFTLDGTRAYLVGKKNVAVIDPGPDESAHVRALASTLESAGKIQILLTHTHRDHSGAVPTLTRLLNPEVSGPVSTVEMDLRGISATVLREGDVVRTDQGELRVVEVPGHTRDHLAFHWVQGGALFVGDLLLGKGATTWVGEYPESVEDYLRSLQKVRSLSPRILYPAHGPPLTEPGLALDRFESHRVDRIAQVESVLRTDPDVSARELLEKVYGAALPSRVRGAAEASMEAIIHYLRHRRRG